MPLFVALFLTGTVLQDPSVGYQKWKLVTPTPLDMSPALALLCRSALVTEVENPHNPRVFRVFVNKAGEKAMMKRGRGNFPDGTVIVKEKYPRKSKLDPKSFELATIMLKMDGVWHYSMIGPDRKPTRADEQVCMKCHRVNKKNDYVFRPYVKGALVQWGGSAILHDALKYRK